MDRQPPGRSGSALSVHPDGRYLQDGDGAPFFWLGDTAWELFHALDRDEAEHYFADRAGKGFNVLQAVLLAEAGGHDTPNAYGDLPFSDGGRLELALTPGSDPEDALEYDYWDHAEWMIQRAGEHGLFVAALPCWGEYVTPRFREATFDTADEAYAYGLFLGERFGKYSHVVWILGGDRLPDERVNGLELWRAMAEGISDGTNGTPGRDGQSDYSTTLMSFHCYRSSSTWFHGDPWLDFHMWGSYHEKRNNERAWFEAEQDWGLPDPKPTLNAEPAYEDGPINYDPELGLGYFDDFDVRQVAYWSVFSGCFGHTYGAHSVFRMWKKEPTASFRRSWQEGLALPGSAQMVHLKNLMLSRPFFERVPNQRVVAENVYDPVGMLRATSGTDYAMVYVPNGKALRVTTGIIRGERLVAWWYDPRTGAASRVGVFPNTGLLEFDAPGETARGNDWVLVLDNAESDFPAPGISDPR